MRVIPIERQFELLSAGNTSPACIAISKLDDSGGCREVVRHKCDQLLRDLVKSTGVSDSESITIRHRTGSAPNIYCGDRISDLTASIAHSGPWIAVGLAREGSIGIDIQVGDNRSRYRDIAKFLSLEAGAQVDEQQFFSSWVLREAIAKVTDSSVLTAHAMEPQLAAACHEHGRPVYAGSFTAMVETVQADTHLAVVLNSTSSSPACI